MNRRIVRVVVEHRVVLTGDAHTYSYTLLSELKYMLDQVAHCDIELRLKAFIKSLGNILFSGDELRFT